MRSWPRLQSVCRHRRKAPHAAHPVNVLIENMGDQLTMLATDIEIQIRTTTAGHIGGEDATITVGARKLQDILRALPDSTDRQPHARRQAPHRQGRQAAAFKLQTLPAADFPRLNPPDDGAARPQHRPAHLQAPARAGVVRHGAAGHPLLPQRPADHRRRQRAAHGRHRRPPPGLRRVRSSKRRSPCAPEAILPRKTVLELAASSPTTTTRSRSCSPAIRPVFRFGSIELVTKLIDGKFP